MVDDPELDRICSHCLFLTLSCVWLDNQTVKHLLDNTSENGWNFAYKSIWDYNLLCKFDREMPISFPDGCRSVWNYSLVLIFETRYSQSAAPFANLTLGLNGLTQHLCVFSYCLAEISVLGLVGCMRGLAAWTLGSALWSRTAVFGLVAIPHVVLQYSLVWRLPSCGWTEKGSGSGKIRESITWGTAGSFSYCKTSLERF